MRETGSGSAAPAMEASPAGTGNGEPVVWRHTDPERFEARPVRTEPFDATRLVIRAGVAEGERIVIRGSELINQIR